MHDDITQAAAELRQFAAELRAGHTIGEEWPEPEVKAEYDRLRALASRLEAARQERGEAVAWQYRVKIPGSGDWSSWSFCCEATAESLILNGGCEVRALYAHPTPDAGRVAELDSLADGKMWAFLHDSLHEAFKKLSATGGGEVYYAALDAMAAKLEKDIHGRFIAALESQLAEAQKQAESQMAAKVGAMDLWAACADELADKEHELADAMAQLAESQEREGRMREALEWVARTPGESAYWLNRVIAALAADKEQK